MDTNASDSFRAVSAPRRVLGQVRRPAPFPCAQEQHPGLGSERADADGTAGSAPSAGGESHAGSAPLSWSGPGASEAKSGEQKDHNTTEVRVILLAYWFQLSSGPRLFIEWREGEQSKRVTIEESGRVRQWK